MVLHLCLKANDMPGENHPDHAVPSTEKIGRVCTAAARQYESKLRGRVADARLGVNRVVACTRKGDKRKERAFQTQRGYTTEHATYIAHIHNRGETGRDARQMGKVKKGVAEWRQRRCSTGPEIEKGEKEDRERRVDKCGDKCSSR